MSRYQWSIVLFVLVEGGIYFQFQGSTLFYPLLALGLFTFLALLFTSSMNLSFQFFAEASLKSKKGTVAIGFDDGPEPTTTMEILKILDDHNAKAAFFIIGNNAVKYPEIVKEIINRGHKLGSHSKSHPINFGFLSHKKVAVEILDGIKLVEEISESKVDLFRPPFGITNPRIAKVIRKNKLQLIGWNLRSFDTASKDPDRLLNRLKKKIKSGSSILLHDTMPITVEVLPALLKEIQNKNLVIRPDFD